MSQLLLMRHAKSDRKSQVGSDIERPLNKRGQRDAPRMGQWLKALGLVPDVILSSPAVRARQTADAVAKALGFDTAQIGYSDALYLADRQTLLSQLAGMSGTGSRVLLVAHNPGMDDLVNWLASEPPPLAENGKLMTTAAVALFELPGEGFQAKKGQGLLQQLMRPRDLPE